MRHVVRRNFVKARGARRTEKKNTRSHVSTHPSSLIPHAQKKKEAGSRVGPILLGFFIFVVVGSGESPSGVCAVAQQH